MPQKTHAGIANRLLFHPHILPKTLVFKGVVKKYRPDFLIRLKSGKMLVLEVKG
jgi:hypothetical protein